MDGAVYAGQYEYQDANERYLATETNEVRAACVIKNSINALTIGTYNGFYETLVSLVIGYYCPGVGAMLDIVSLLKDTFDGELDAMSFGAFIAGLLNLDEMEMILSYFSSASDIIDCDVSVGDPIVHISFNAGAHAEYIYDTNGNIKRVGIHYL